MRYFVLILLVVGVSGCEIPPGFSTANFEPAVIQARQASVAMATAVSAGRVGQPRPVTPVPSAILTEAPLPPVEEPPLPTEVPPPTETPVPVGLFIQITVPGDGAVIESAAGTAFQAIAYDPDVGTSDGAGIASVQFSIQQIAGNGSYSHSRVERQAAYCAYGGDGPCATIPDWDTLGSGTYQLTATANAAGKPSVSRSITFSKP